MAPCEALYGRRFRTPLFVSKTENTTKVIQDCLKVASDRQKSYADLKRKDIEFSLELPPELNRIHDVFYVSMLRRYRSNPSYFVSVDEIELRPDLTFEEEHLQILDYGIKMLRKKTIPLVKVLWQNHGAEEAMWEQEESIRLQYPYLFDFGKF
ncbi:uncharacterized protein [Gossypium hirsutum]|uniref:DNA/RNA polymerases superfamily protein n=1 Tax=Gossypium hirsutum TaxID=3635 RepID=A0A1U8LSE6_GOSHI|nr:uncharacterized protein LOC107929432 [Gossypium hirsutum]